jgi:hypothetical protein
VFLNQTRWGYSVIGQYQYFVLGVPVPRNAVPTLLLGACGCGLLCAWWLARRLSFFAALSLLLCWAALSLGVVSQCYGFDYYSQAVGTAGRVEQIDLVFDSSDDGWFWVGCGRNRILAPPKAAARAPGLRRSLRAVPNFEVYWPFDRYYTFEAPNPNWWIPFSDPPQFQPGQTTDDWHHITIPWWLLVVLFSLAPLLGVIRRWRSIRRSPHGFCARCGYNLTANVSGTCPECGTPIMAGGLLPTSDAHTPANSDDVTSTSKASSILPALAGLLCAILAVSSLFMLAGGLLGVGYIVAPHLIECLAGANPGGTLFEAIMFLVTGSFCGLIAIRWGRAAGGSV